MNAAAALSSATGELAAAGCETPRLDAELLLADSLGVARGRLHSEPELELDQDARTGFADALRRRAGEREPVAYIVSRRGFRELELAVDARALIPRPETEHLVESALSLPAGWRVLDVGTGCGAVALALAGERPDLEVHGSDLSRAGARARRARTPAAWSSPSAGCGPTCSTGSRVPIRPLWPTFPTSPRANALASPPRSCVTSHTTPCSPARTG